MVKMAWDLLLVSFMLVLAVVLQVKRNAMKLCQLDLIHKCIIVETKNKSRSSQHNKPGFNAATELQHEIFCFDFDIIFNSPRIDI